MPWWAILLLVLASIGVGVVLCYIGIAIYLAREYW